MITQKENVQKWRVKYFSILWYKYSSMMSQICYHGTHLAHVIVPQGKTFNKLAYTNFLMNNSSFTFCTRENVIKRTFSEKTENCIISFALYSSFKKLIIPRHDTLYKIESLPGLWCISNLATFTFTITFD